MSRCPVRGHLARCGLQPHELVKQAKEHYSHAFRLSKIPALAYMRSTIFTCSSPEVALLLSRWEVLAGFDKNRLSMSICIELLYYTYSLCFSML